MIKSYLVWKVCSRTLLIFFLLTSKPVYVIMSLFQVSGGLYMEYFTWFGLFYVQSQYLPNYGIRHFKNNMYRQLAFSSQRALLPTTFCHKTIMYHESNLMKGSTRYPNYFFIINSDCTYIWTEQMRYLLTSVTILGKNIPTNKIGPH